MPHAYLITGANRGIGLELARRLKDAKNIVIGTARDPDDAEALASFADRVERLDVSDTSSCRALGGALASVPIDVLVNNAGQSPARAGLAEVDPDDVVRHLSVNAVGALRVAQAVLPSLERGGEKKIINISSNLGSIEQAGPDFYAYSMGKAALNMLSAKLAAELGPRGFTCVSVHPGWVKTRMGGEQAPVELGDSAAGLIEVITRMSKDNNGGYFDYQGAGMPW